jgi:putative transcriptional regulator
MDKKLFGELISSIREAGKIARNKAKAKRVHVYSAQKIREMQRRFKPAEIVKVRHQLKMSQAEFAGVMLIRKTTLQSWEQGRRQPEGPALVLITVMRKNPQAVIAALHAETRPRNRVRRVLATRVPAK